MGPVLTTLTSSQFAISFGIKRPGPELYNIYIYILGILKKTISFGIKRPGPELDNIYVYILGILKRTKENLHTIL